MPSRVDIPALSFSEEKFRSLFQSTQEAILLCDAATRVVVDANPAANRLLGRSGAELIGLRHQELFPELPMEFPQEGQWETRVQRADGVSLPVALSCSCFSLDHWHLLLTVFQDISTRKAAEETLHIQSEALHHAGDVILIVDVDGEIRFANSACKRVLAIAPETLIGQPWQNLGQIFATPGQLKEMITATTSRGEAWRGRVSGQGTAGEYILDMAVTPLRRQNGVVERMLLVGRDLLQEVRLERQLLQAQKLEAIGTMAGGIAHDFNNILFAILGRLELAMDPLQEENPLWSHLQAIRVSSQRAQELVKQLLAFSRAHKGERTTISLSGTVQESLEMLRTALPPTIRVETRFADDAPAVLADATQICQVMINLGSNAAFAMGQGGGVLEVVVDRARFPEDEAAFPGTGLAAGEYAMLAVRDSGCGISREYLGMVFDPFFTTKPVGKGTGLGLSVVHGVVSHHGGIVTVESETGEGTIFRVFLPASSAPLPREENTPLPHGSERILVVDDDRLVASVLDAYLTSLGYRVTAKTNATEAWRLFEEHPGNYDMVIADRTMPGPGGEVLLQQVRSLRPGLATLMLTGCDEANRDVAVGSLQKPFSKKELAVAVRGCLMGGG